MPSCHQKKVLFFGEFLAGDVLAPVPHRHWILALPKMLRPYFKFHRALLKDLCRIAHQCLTEYFRSAVGLPEAVPTDFIAAVTQHIPDKGFQLVRYYGWYSNKARGVRAKTGAAQAEDSAQGHEPDRAPTSAQWRRLIAKIWEADPLTCPDCGAEMKILAFIEEDRRHRKNSQASGPTPRRLARSAAPGARLRADLQRLARRGRGRRCLPALLSAQREPSETARSCFLAPGPATRKPKTRPNQREKPKTALTAARGSCKLRKSWSEVRFRSETKPGRRRSAPGPENQIPIPGRLGSSGGGAAMIKRALDVAVSGAVLAATAPILAAVGAAIAVKMGQPVVFSHARPGKDEKLFQMYKFRTMTDARGPDGEPLPDAERITPLGRFLRKTSLDELPALLNVLKGEMSLVGPRPLMVQYLPYFTDRERLRHTVLPGITGWAQIHGRNEVPWDRRLALDVWYVENQSLWLDLKILAATARMVLKREGVVDPRSTMLNLDEERAGRQRRVGPAERA